MFFTQTTSPWPAVDGATGYGLRENAALLVSDGRIAWLGRGRGLRADADVAEVVDCAGRLITPGLIDCHTHPVYGGDRADEFEMRLEGASYAEIAAAGGGILSTVNATRRGEDESARRRATPAPAAIAAPRA